ncbi:MAG: flagellin, partial [Chloroflexota bacterium]
ATSDNVTSDNLTDPNELFLITVDLRPVSDNVTPEQRLGANRTFMLEVKPPTGAILPIERTVPARTNQIINLY